jgi:hypothetical protein
MILPSVKERKNPEISIGVKKDRDADEFIFL